MIGAMPRWLAWALAGACAVPTVVVLRAGGDVALAGASPWAQALVVGAGLAVVAAAAAAQDDRSVRRRMLAAGGAAWLAAEWANPATPGAALFTAGWIATGLALPLVLGATLAGAGAVRALAAGALVLAAGGAVLQGPARAFAADPRAAGCPDCPADLLAIASRPDLAEQLGRLGAWLALGACGAAFLALALGVLRSSPAARRRLSAIAAPTSAFAAASGAELWLTLRGGLAAPGVRTAHLLVAVALIALALGTRVRPLLLRRARRAVAAATTAVRDTNGDALVGALAPVVGDGSLELAYAVPGIGWVDAAGHPVELPASGSGRATTLIQDAGAPLAALVHDAGIQLDEGLLAEGVAAGRLRLDAERLQAAVLARVEELRNARRRVVEAAEEERRRLERDLHDGAQQRLVALRFTLGLAQSRAARSGLPLLEGRLSAADAALEHSLEDLRELAHGLYPPSLDAEGLATAVRTAADRAGLAVIVEPLPSRRLPVVVERTAYRVVVDTLAVAARAGAHAARVEASEADGRLIVRVEHDAPRGEPRDAALLDDRVGTLAGNLRIERSSTGRTTVVAELPCG
jgi:signal transduction histidine kinase